MMRTAGHNRAGNPEVFAPIVDFGGGRVNVPRGYALTAEFLRIPPSRAGETPNSHEFGYGETTSARQSPLNHGNGYFVAMVNRAFRALKSKLFQTTPFDQTIEPFFRVPVRPVGIALVPEVMTIVFAPVIFAWTVLVPSLRVRPVGVAVIVVVPEPFFEPVMVSCPLQTSPLAHVIVPFEIVPTPFVSPAR